MAKGLNEQQRAAVKALNGRVLIRAGAGSGKTRTLADRFAASVEDHADDAWTKAAVDEVLTITYTEKAAAELTGRIRSTLRSQGRQEEARRVDSGWISTIHSFCTRILRRYALEAGIDPAFSIADTVEAGRIIEKSFETAARAALLTDGGERLFGAFEFDALFSATTEIAAVLRTRGLEAKDIELEYTPDAASILAQVIGVFSTSESRIRCCNSSVATVAKQLATCTETVEMLREIDSSTLAPDEIGMQVWMAIESWKGGTRCKDTAEVIDRIRAELPELIAQAAACAAAPLARGLRALVSEYVSVYAEAKRARGLLDFDDLQSMARDLIVSREDVRRALARQFRLVMVDEFQDTDCLQLQLLEAVAGDNLCTVGDERQSIYRFRGADLDVYRQHYARMINDGARSIELSQNYRSHGDVLGFANEVFGRPVLFGEALLKLEHERDEPRPPVVPDGCSRIRITRIQQHRGESVGVTVRRAEAVSVAEQFAELRDDYGVKPSDMVVLLRAYTGADDYAQALRERGFETLIIGGSRFFDVSEVLCLRAFLRAAANPADEEALAEVLASPLAGLSDDALWVLRRNSTSDESQRGGLWEALELLGEQVSTEQLQRARRARDLIEGARRRSGRVPLSEIVLRAMEESDFDLRLLAAGDAGYQGYANVLKLARMADEFEASGGSGPAEFESYLVAKESFGDHTSPATLADDQTPAVRILSIHSSKGLEFPVVAVPELGSGGRSDSGPARWRVVDGGVQLAVSLPSAAAKGDKTHRSTLFIELSDAEKVERAEEEKRLFYVACTRAREVLLLSGSRPGSEADPTRSRSAMLWLEQALSEAATEHTDEGVMIGDIRVRIDDIDLADWEPPHVDKPVRRNPESALSESAGRPAEEPEHAEPPEPPKSLSYSDLGLFADCRKRFWAEKILRLGSLRLGVPGDARTFGSAVHSVLQSVGSGGELPSENRIAAIARFHELTEPEAMRLRAAVKAWGEAAVSRELNAMSTLRREWPFAVALGPGSPFLFAGKIDAYGRSGSQGLVVDYKTGSSGSGEELRQRYALQARCYALVALKDGCERVKVSFVRPEVTGLRGEPEEVDFEFTAADAAGIEGEIVAVRELMSTETFEPRPGWDPFVCHECPIAGGICPVKPPRART